MSSISKNRSFFGLLLLVSALLISPGVSKDHVTALKADEQQATVTAPKPVAATNHYSLKINSIGLDVPLKTTALDKQGHLMVPDNPNQAAWYARGPKPGGAGTALITGHLDSLAGPGVFWNLKKVKVNDLIEVQKPDGSTLVFKVDKIESYAQNYTFPWKQVYSAKGEPSIRIITCDGEYNPQTGRYSRNLVVYASVQSPQN